MYNRIWEDLFAAIDFAKWLHTDAAAVRKPFGESWTSECETAFQALKTSLMQAPVLAIADPALPYELHTDASGTGLGAALYQKRDGVLRPVAYASHGLSISESHYPAHKLEFWLSDGQCATNSMTSYTGLSFLSLLITTP